MVYADMVSTDNSYKDYSTDSYNDYIIKKFLFNL